jgi:hypothetical protein
MQLIEIADQNWCPSVLRDALTQFLQLSTQRGKYYGAILQRLKQALIQARSQRVVDLCSGSGGPWISMQEEIQDTEVTEIVLTDLRPNIQAVASQTAERIIYRSEPVDARDVPPGLTGFRTLFTSFHHFSPHNAAAILKNAVQANQGIGIFEMTERRLSVILRVLITTPLIAIFLIPFCRPFRLGYLFWTYIVPIIPLLIAFDGTISCFRTYTVEELGDMINQLRAPGYEWNIGREKSEDHHGPFTITYCIGIPIISREPDRTVDGSAQVIDTQQKG